MSEYNERQPVPTLEERARAKGMMPYGVDGCGVCQTCLAADSLANVFAALRREREEKEALREAIRGFLPYLPLPDSAPKTTRVAHIEAANALRAALSPQGGEA